MKHIVLYQPQQLDNYPVMEVNVIPEFPTWTPILLRLTGLTLVLAVYKRGLQKAPTHP